MRIYVVRHAIAEDRIVFHKEQRSAKKKQDDTRPLTAKGKKAFAKVSKKLSSLCGNVNEIYASPLTRAVQTAELLEKRFKKKFKIINELKPDQPHNVLLEFLKRRGKENIIIVGHEPFLSSFVGYCVTGQSISIVEMKKGGLCILAQSENRKGEFVIKGLFSPKQILKI